MARPAALADFRYEPFAQAEIARLEELQLACLEERNDRRSWRWALRARSRPSSAGR